MAADLAVENDLAAAPFARGHLRRHGELVVARRQNIIWLKGELGAVENQNRAAEDDVAVIARAEAIGAVLLQVFAERGRDRFAQTRFGGLVGERIDLDRARAGTHAIGGTQMVAGTTGESQD